MLKLKNIVKDYISGNETVKALKSLSLEFRKNEFVSVLGPSGCGKTTLLNIIGGLDRYTSGDIIIDGCSTKKFTDYDWDSYRNHSVGFVFQSYNLIPHQSVLSNVELALTLSGVSKAERKQRAIEALKKVGLEDKIKQRPNQLSGGQMQRVAIARALVNNPEILLADEPTGALDSETSIQVMELLKEIANDRLVIMVTHNPELAESYSTRIVKMTDGVVVDDSNPYFSEEENSDDEKSDSKVKIPKQKKVKKDKKKSMSFTTALSLSLNNLMTKKGRTLMTSFAGSIGIIGIAMILALSSGIQAYIDKVQNDTLSAYPIVIEEKSMDMGALITNLTNIHNGGDDHSNEEKVYSNVIMYEMLDAMTNFDTKTNNMADFVKFLESNQELNSHISAVKYGYNLDLNVYSYNSQNEIIMINPSTLLDGMISGPNGPNSTTNMPMMNSYDIWEEMLEGSEGELISDAVKSQYNVLKGRWPENSNEIVLRVNANNQISDVTLYSLGFKDPEEFRQMMLEYYATGKAPESEEESWDFDDIIGKEYKLVMPTDYYRFDENKGIYRDLRDDENSDIYLTELVEKATPLKIVGIIRQNPDAASAVMSGTIGYTKALTDEYIQKINNSEIVKYQTEHKDTNIFTGEKFYENLTEEEKTERAKEYIANMSEKDKAKIYRKILIDNKSKEMTDMFMQTMKTREDLLKVVEEGFRKQGKYTEDQIADYMKSVESFSDELLQKRVRDAVLDTTKSMLKEQYSKIPDSTIANEFDTIYLPTLSDEGYAKLLDYVPRESSLKENYKILGVVDKSNPSSVSIYAATFEDKNKINDLIEQYNNTVPEEDKIEYTDYVALMMSSISEILKGISIVLIIFVSVSLVVSSIMIGIITYISVLERTKEIGILRAIGASKGDVSRVFNAETLIIGFSSGLVGILATYLLCIPINIIVHILTGINTINAILPWQGAVILVAISMILTFISGLIPSRMAASKDPVTALRSE